MKRKKVLAITNSYLPKPNAIGVCLETVMHELELRGYETYVVTMTEGPEYIKIEDCNIYNVPMEKRKIAKNVLVRKTRTAFRILRDYPLESPQYIERYTGVVKKLMEENEFEFVMCIQKPTIAGVVGIEIKKIYPKIPVILFEFDSLTDNNANYSSWTRFFANRNRRLEKRIYDRMDFIIHMIERKEHLQKPQYEKYKEKDIFVDVPLLDERLYQGNEYSVGKADGEREIKCIYSGMLYQSFRTPEYFIKLMEHLSNRNLLHCDFYSKGDCEEILEQGAEKLENRITPCGYVPKTELDERMKEADVFLNIGNSFDKDIASIPSKVFYYISFGKPIIHISPKKEDLSEVYLKKYPHALILSTETSIAENAKKLEEFLQNLPMQKCPWEFLKEVFYENTAEYCVNEIMKALGKE